MPIYPDPRPPLERTGAGDAFSSTFAIALAQGKSIEEDDDIEDAPTTTWHDDIDEGFWFAINCAYDPWIEINKVICLKKIFQK